MPHSHLAMRLSVLCVMLLGLFLAAGAQVKETVLPNGLTVLIKEVHAAPVVTVDAWYKAGSRNERPGLTGMSHLLEHMTYKGAKGFDRDAMRDIIRRHGALNNGATFYDYTHYYTTIASDRVDPILRIEAARMGSSTLKQADLDSEWTVVRSELEGRENDPGSLLFSELMAAAYKASPYQWPVIGWRADVEHTRATDLLAYYKSYYVPNNATLVIVGDVDAAQMLAKVRKYYGGLKRGPAPSQWTTPEPTQRGERRVTVRRQGKVPMIDIAWHVPALTHGDIPALMLLDQLLGTGRLSRLYATVVETRQGVSAWSSTLLLRDSSLFFAGAAVQPGGALATVEATLLAEVEKLKATPPTAEEMARAQRQVEASLVYGRDSVSQQASQLGYYQTVAGDWGFLDKLPARLRAVRPEDITRVAKLYLTEDNRTVASFLPTTPGAQKTLGATAAPAGYREADTPTAPLAVAAMRGGAGVVAAPVKAVARQRFVLPNGLVLIVQENHANATVAVQSTLRAGKAYDPAGRTGVAEMVANLLDFGTTTRSANQIATELEGNAAELSAGTGWETAVVRGKALRGDTELLLRNLADIVRNPAFPAAEVEKMREQSLTGLAMDRDEPGENAYRGFYRAALPAGHPYRLASFDEEEAGLKALTRDDLLAFHKARYVPGTMILVVVGDVKVDEVHALVVRYFGDWQGAKPPLVAFPAAVAAPGGKVIVNIPDKSQVNILAGTADGLKRDAPDYYAAQIMNMILGGGGALNSRLGDVIRDKNGLAYNVYSAFHASTGTGPWYAMMGVNRDNVDKSLELLKAEITRMREKGVTPEELTGAVNYITGSHATVLVTNAAIAGALQDAEYFGLGLDYPERESALYRAVTRDQVNAAAKQYLHPDRLVISIAGPYGR